MPSALWLLPLGALALVAIGLVASKSPQRRADAVARDDAPEAAPRMRRPRLQAWAVDLIVGVCVGVPLAYGLGQSALASNAVEAEGVDGIIFAACGAVLGVGFMRVIRRPRAAGPESAERQPPRDPDYDE